VPRDEALATLAARDYQTYVETFADTPGVTVTIGGGVRIRRSPIDDDYLNSVFGAVLTPDSVDATIRRTIDEFRHDGQAFHWLVWPDDRPSELVERLEAAGLERLDAIPLMTLDLARLGAPEPPPAGLVVREATDPAEQLAVAAFAVRAVGWDPPEPPTPFAATFLRLAAERPPRWRMFGGWLDDELVTTAALFTGSGMAGIYAVLTADAMRGRGYGRVVTRAALHAGREDGRTTGVLMASDLGLPVYRRIGFEVVGDVQVVRWPGPATMDARGSHEHGEGST
jgi:GNAT superfamily N-acetyltransferase